MAVWTSPTRTMPAFKPLVSCEKAALTSPLPRDKISEEEENCSRSCIKIRPEARDCIQRETWCMGPYAGVDYNLTLCPLQHMYHGQ
jgi:hypothetical protein